MKRIRRMGTALILATLMATATLEAKKPGGGGQDATICTYLASVITYPYVTPTIQAAALALFAQLGCDPALLQ